LKGKESDSRVLLKISGNIMSDESGSLFSKEVVPFITREISSVIDAGFSLAIVIGAGNIIRGREVKNSHINRMISDNAGMLATVINGLILHNWITQNRIPVRIYSAFKASPIVDVYNPLIAKKNLEEGEVVILTGGTGNILFSTDTAAVIRSIELDVDILIKGTDVDGIYDKDPEKNKNAKLYDEITYQEYISKDLRVMDLTAISIASEHNLPVFVYKFDEEGGLLNILKGNGKGTHIRR
jgi:uridylate kinase